MITFMIFCEITRVFERHVHNNLVAHFSRHAIGAERHHLDNIATVRQQTMNNGPLENKTILYHNTCF